MRKLIAALASVTIACQIILGIDDEPGVARRKEAPVDSAPPDPCKKHQPPPPSPNAPPRSTTAPPMFFALDTFKLRPASEPLLGYDLDDHCTGNDASTTSEAVCLGHDPRYPSKDGDGGIDNAMGEIAAAFTVFDPEHGDDPVGREMTAELTLGNVGMIIIIGGYGGGPDAADVSVSIIPSPGVESVDREPVPYDGGAPQRRPNHDGGDSWYREPGSLPDAPHTLSTLPGYISNFTLVVRADVETQLGSARFRFRRGILTAQLDPTGHRLTNGIFAGTIRATDLILAVGSLPYPEPGFLFCKSETAFSAVPGLVCGARDALYEVTSDLSKPCDSLTMTLGFTAVRASVGAVRDASYPFCTTDASCEGL